MKIPTDWSFRDKNCKNNLFCIISEAWKMERSSCKDCMGDLSASTETYRVTERTGRENDGTVTPSQSSVSRRFITQTNRSIGFRCVIVSRYVHYNELYVQNMFCWSDVGLKKRKKKPHKSCVIYWYG